MSILLPPKLPFKSIFSLLMFYPVPQMLVSTIKKHNCYFHCNFIGGISCVPICNFFPVCCVEKFSYFANSFSCHNFIHDILRVDFFRHRSKRGTRKWQINKHVLPDVVFCIKVCSPDGEMYFPKQDSLLRHYIMTSPQTRSVKTEVGRLLSGSFFFVLLWHHKREVGLRPGCTSGASWAI